MIAEYWGTLQPGWPHLQPQGWHHGGHDEHHMAQTDTRPDREIKRSRSRRAVVFAWMDEWFKKKNWIVTDYEIPPENTRLWHNVMDAEQSCWTTGDLCGGRDRTPVPGESPARWLALDACDSATTAQKGAPGSPCRKRRIVILPGGSSLGDEGRRRSPGQP